MMTELTTKIKLKEDKPENWETLSAETIKKLSQDIAELQEPIPSDCSMLNDLPDLVEKFEEDKAIEKINDKLNNFFEPRNRAERRALDKATRRQKAKKKKMYVDSIKEATKKLAYIDMIEKVREMNERIKKEGEQENEATN